MPASVSSSSSYTSTLPPPCAPSLSRALASIRQHPWIVAHRGDWRRLPENSTAAVLSAAAAGADMVEIDAQSIADGTLIVLHDDDLDRTTDRSGAVAGLTRADVGGIRLRAAAGGAAAPVTRHGLPVLSDLLESVRGQVLINIDTKHRRDLDAVCALVLGMGLADQVLVKMTVSPGGDGSEFRDAPWFGQLEFMPICPEPPKGRMAETFAAVARATDARIIEIAFADLDELAAAGAAVERAGAAMWTNTLDPVHSLSFSDSRALHDAAGIWGRLLGSGISAIQTDQTAALAAYLRRGA